MTDTTNQNGDYERVQGLVDQQFCAASRVVILQEQLEEAKQALAKATNDAWDGLPSGWAYVTRRDGKWDIVPAQIDHAE